MTNQVKHPDIHNHNNRFAIKNSRPGNAYFFVKRTIDILGSLLVIVCCAPVITICAAWIKIVDAGPAFYTQWRVGENGWLFKIYKLRTMYQDAEKKRGAQFSCKGDTRVLPGCKWIRQCHADELPQLINILIGHMSLVGPRPERPEIIDWLKKDIPTIEQRLATTPGLTGLAQLKNGYTNDVKGARNKQAFDLKYIRRRSIFKDLKLVLATVPKVWDQAAY